MSNRGEFGRANLDQKRGRARENLAGALFQLNAARVNLAKATGVSKRCGNLRLDSSSNTNLFVEIFLLRG